MERSDFQIALTDVCQRLRSFLTDETNDWLVDLFAGGNDSQSADDQDRKVDIPRIYEILVYLTMVHEVSRTTPVTCIKASGKHGYRLPYSPAEKRNFAFFRLNHNGQTYDLCNGTALPVEEEPDEHPDISLQQMKSANAESEPGIPRAIWDAKHHDKAALSKADIAQMFLWGSIFGLANYMNDGLLGKLFPAQFQVSSIVTNASRKPPHRKPLLRNGFSVVLDFRGPAAGRDPDPSPDEHLIYQQTST